jgi:hypothetical protein
MGPRGCRFTGAAPGVAGSEAAVDHHPVTDSHGRRYLHPYLVLYCSYYVTHMGPHGCWYTGVAIGVAGSGAAVDHDPATDGHGGGYLHPYLARLAAHRPGTAARVPQPLQTCGAAPLYIQRNTCPCSARGPTWVRARRRAHTNTHRQKNTQTERKT